MISSEKKTISQLYVISKFLSRITSQYRHRLSNPLLKLRLELEQLSKIIDVENLKAKECISDIHKVVNQINEISDWFTLYIPDYISFGPTNIKACLDKAISYFDSVSLKREENIEISVSCHSQLLVYASDFLIEHIYNVLENSLHAVRDNLNKKKISSGSINIDVLFDEKIDRDKNYVIIEIKDNGGGVLEGALQNIGKVGFTTKEYGSGYGLYAAIVYIQSIGGSLTYENDSGKGFTVIMKIPKFNKDIHQSIKKQRKI